MGAYIYKAKKIMPFKDNHLAFMDFWYKPCYGYDVPSWEARLEGIGDRFLSNWENGVKYVAFAPTGTETWNNKVWCNVYQAENFPVVINDYNKTWDTYIRAENVICQVRTTKSGNKLEVIHDVPKFTTIAS